MMRRPPLTVVLAALLVLALAVPAGAQSRSLSQIEAELERAQEQLEATQGRIDAATERLDELQEQTALLEAEADELAAVVRRQQGELAELERLIVLRVRESFKFGAQLDPIAVFLASDEPDAALRRAQTVGRLVAADRTRTEGLVAAQQRLAADEARLAEQRAELAALLDEQEELREQLQASYAELEETERSLSAEARAERERLERIRREREERERREREARAAAARAAAASGGGSGGSSGGGATTSGGSACPLDRPRSFTDTWGAPRSGGRRHRGTDIMGPHGIPVRAIVDGTWHIQRPGPSAGLWGILRGRDGNHYWYLHLSSHTVANGASVRAGQQIGTNGATGNAPPNAPHVHFELHPGGGSAINPYPLLRRVCG